MKRLETMLLLLVCISFAQAAPVDQQKARQVAEQFMQSRGVKLSGGPMRAPGKMNASATTQPLYIFNAADNKGFVVVAGDDCADPVLGYADKGQYNENQMPENFRYWIEKMAEDIERASLALEYNPTLVQNPKRIPNHNAISPLIKTKWDQGSPTQDGYIFNVLCPLIDGKHAYTGCVATAGAQVMYYYQYPKKKTKAVPGYESGVAATSEGLPAITFGWDKMKTMYGSSDRGTESETAVAQLMKYCGYAAHMSYGLSGSGASVSILARGLVEYFDYDPYAYKMVYREDYGIAGWDELIYNELAQRRPIIYSGSGYGGHAFICDGYDGNGYYHFNWGWGGSSDGYFKLQATNPYEGDGSQDIGYCLEQYACIGLQPNTGVVPSSGTSGEDEWEEVTISGIVGTASNVVVDGNTVTMRLSNYNDDTYNFGFGIGELMANGSINVIDTKYEYYKSTSLPPRYGFSGCSFDFSSYNLSKGKHTLVPISLLKGETTWKRCRPADIYFEVTVSASGTKTIVAHPIEKITANVFEPVTKGIPDKSLGVKVSVKNEGDNYYGYLSLFATKTSDFGSERDWQRIKIKSGNSKEYMMNFTPEEAGTYTLYLCLNENTNKVIATTTAIVAAPTVKVTSFSIPGSKIATISQKVVATVKSTGNEFADPLYLFASTTTTKGSYVYLNGTAIEQNATEDVNFYFKPDKAGKWNLWVCTDSEGKNVIGSTTVTIASAPTENVTLAFVSGEYVSGDTYKIKVRNAGNVDFYRYIRSWISDTSEDGQAYVPSEDATIKAGATAEIFFKYDSLKPGHTYSVILNYPVNIGATIWGYLGQFNFTVPAGLPGDVDNSGEVSVQDVSYMVSNILGLQPDPFNFTNADLNNDGIIDVKDVMSVVAIILGK